MVDAESVAPGSIASLPFCGMRNILVHDYLEVHDEAVWSALGRLDDLRQFAAAAQRLID